MPPALHAARPSPARRREACQDLLVGISVVMMVLAFVGIVVSIRHMRDLGAGSIVLGLVSAVVCLAMLLIGAALFAWASS
jgi:hypothetical protein